MQKSNSKWFVNQVLDAIEKAGKERLNLDLPSRLLLIAISKCAYKSGRSHALASQLEDISGIRISNQTKYLKILKDRNFITIKRNYYMKEDKKMTKNTYTVNLNIILNLSIDKESVGIEIKDACINNEPFLQDKNRSEIEPFLRGKNIKPILQKQNQKKDQKPLYIAPVQVLTGFENSPESLNTEQVVSMPVDYYFEDFWASYPRKEKKVEARRIWIREKLDSIADKIIEDVRQRQVRYDRWEDRKFIPYPTTYLNNEGWNDEIIERRQGTKNENGSEPGNIRSYAEQLLRAANNLGGVKNVHPMQDHMGRKVD